MKRWQSPQVVPIGLTEGQLKNKLSTLRPKLNDVSSSSVLTVLCVLFFSLFRKSSTYLIGRSYQTVDTVLVD